ncbi:MAG: DEAD/DEAH box helicase family protein [Ignavibacteriales bacterium]|nr:DEAD/DEAH box helicase family protein [Ignavibacteriales bacterium]
MASLVEFLQDYAENKDIERAYSHATEKHFGQSGIYNDAGFDIPYICLRLPTGGGKTLLASHTIPVVCREFLARDFSLVIWLVPSNAILEQTYNCLQDASHPYRIILEEAFDGHLEVMKVEDALSVSKGTMQSIP